jgi:uncharacterized protein (TIGR03067 family)
MRKGLVCFVILAGFAANVTLADDDTKVAEELKAMAGNYTVKKWNINNTQSWMTKAGNYKAVIKGNEMVVTYMGKERNKSTFKLDPTKTPKQITLTRTEDNQTFVEEGIYELKDDTLVICVGDSDPNNRPKELKFGKGRTFIILERNK